jgi:hypothetical protein
MKRAVCLAFCLFLACPRTRNVSNCTLDGSVCPGNQVCAPNSELCADPVVLTSVSPSMVPQGGGVPLTITGSGFQPGATVTIGGTPVDVASGATTTTLQVTAPTQVACSAVAVQVSNPDGTTATRNDLLRYAASSAPTYKARPLTANGIVWSGSVDQVALVDLDGDGHDDLIVKDASTAQPVVALFAGRGGGTFAYSTKFNNPQTAPSGLRVRDVNGDGKPDLVLFTRGAPASDISVSLAPNPGDLSTFGSPMSMMLPGSLSIMDLAISTAPGATASSVSLLLAVGTELDSLAYPPMGATLMPIAKSQQHGLLLANVETATAAEQLIGLTGSTAVLYEQQGPSWVAKSTTTVGASSGRVGDVTGDGVPDLVSASDAPTSLSVSAGDGKGSFAAPLTVATPTITGSMYELAYFRCTGAYGIVYVSGHTQFQFVVMNPDHTFTTPTTLFDPALGNIVSFAAKDLNDDGQPDLVYSTATGALMIALSGS